MYDSNVFREHYFQVSETLFDNNKEPSINGNGIYINFTGCLAFLSHSTLSNNEYNYGAFYVTNADLISQWYICYHNNMGHTYQIGNQS